MGMDGDLTWGANYTIAKLYTWYLYNFINQCHPNKFNNKEKKKEKKKQSNYSSPLESSSSLSVKSRVLTLTSRCYPSSALLLFLILSPSAFGFFFSSEAGLLLSLQQAGLHPSSQDALSLVGPWLVPSFPEDLSLPASSSESASLLYDFPLVCLGLLFLTYLSDLVESSVKAGT